MGVKLGLSHSWKNTHWWRSRLGSWGKYLDLRGRKWQQTREKCI